MKPRRPWLAALLSLLGGGPLGQIYIGRLRRSFLLWLGGSSLSFALAFAAISLPIQWPYLDLFLVLYIAAVPIGFAVDAFLLARRERFTPPKRYQRRWVYVLFFVLFVAGNVGVRNLVRAFIAEAFFMPAGSMSPTILPGDRIVVDKLWYRRDRIQRGDVVVFRSEGPGSPLFIQRVVGLPGDEIEIKNERVLINRVPRDDPHAVFTGPLPPYGELVDYGPAEVPDHHFFFLGDNRRCSMDSRMIGTIPASDLYGVARFIYWSREYVFPDPTNPNRSVPGPIHWDRHGRRLD